MTTNARGNRCSDAVQTFLIEISCHKNKTLFFLFMNKTSRFQKDVFVVELEGMNYETETH